MTILEFVWIDVFARKRLEGNQLAVFTDARGLTGDQMQLIARETGLSETTFVFPESRSRQASDGIRTRIFTTAEELPFAGHPTLGTAMVLRGEKNIDEIVLNLNVGKIPVRFSETGDKIFGEMTQMNPTFGMVHDAGKISRALGIDVSDIDSSLPVQTVSTGNPFIIVPFKRLETLQNLVLEWKTAQSYLEKSDARFFYLVSGDVLHPESILHARMIYYGGEDPATGSAAGPAAAWMIRYGLLEPEVPAQIEQGIEILRPSRIFVRGSLDGNLPSNIRVGGYCSEVARGKFYLD
ncbi:MAG: PhzF family phenazine biosynthesis protein [Candidatus Thermoplasmatota archaeon]|nr:PhzF family phenazine biosynthesis protein [Candidatus Thermoplasmatota archaeon]